MFGCNACPDVSVDTVEEVFAHATADHPGRFVSGLVTVPGRASNRPTRFEAHCSFCAAVIVSAVPLSPVPHCPAHENTSPGRVGEAPVGLESAGIGPHGGPPAKEHEP